MSKVMHKSLEAKLASLQGPEWDSSDEEDKQVEAISAVTRKKTRKGKLSKKRKVDTLESKSKDDSSVLYLGHIPEGFAENEMFGFFSQFGTIKRVKLSRSKRTGNPRGYAFLQFADAEVAQIVAETMSGYFLMNRRLVCHVVPKEKIHPELFDGMNNRSKLSFQTVKNWQEKNRNDVNKPKSLDGTKKITEKLIQREKAKRSKLSALGIDYSFPGYTGSLSSKSKDEEESVEPESKKQRKMAIDQDKSVEVPKTPKSSSKKKTKKSSEKQLEVSEKKDTNEETSPVVPSSEGKKKSDEKVKSANKSRKNSESSMESTSEKKKKKKKTPKKEPRLPTLGEETAQSKSEEETREVAKKQIKTPKKKKTESSESNDVTTPSVKTTLTKGLAKTEVKKAKKSKKKRRQSSN